MRDFNIYPFSNEDLNQILNDLSYSIAKKDGTMDYYIGERVLTVCGSGDQPLGCLLRGAKEIDIFDINADSYRFLQFKMECIKLLSYEEFRDLYIFIFNSGTKDINYIKSILNKLKPELRENDIFALFWNAVYIENYSITCNNDTPRFEWDYEINYCEYINDRNKYEKLKQIILSNDFKFNFYNCNILDLDNYIQGKYDSILLSNIIAYIKIRNEQLKIIDLINQHTTEESSYQLCHLYSTNANKPDVTYELKNVPSIYIYPRRSKIHNAGTYNSSYWDKYYLSLQKEKGLTQSLSI